MTANDSACIAVPFRDQWPLLAQCLKSLAAAKTPLPVVLMDTGSSGETLGQVRRFIDACPLDLRLMPVPGVPGLHTENLVGFLGTRPRHLIILNSDTVVTPGFDARLLDVFGAEPECAGVSPVSNTPADLFQFRSGFEDLSGTFVQRVLAFAQQRLAVPGPKWSPAPYLSFTCVALDFSRFEAAEREETPLAGKHYHDLDLCCRMRRGGGRLFVREDTFVWHKGHGTFRQLGQDHLYAEIRKHQDTFATMWGHLPEHRALMERIQFSALYHDIHGNPSIHGPSGYG